MYHHVAHAVPGTLLFRDPVEAHALWVRVIAGLPGLTALCLMPNHVHLLHPQPIKRELGQALSAFARWRNAHRGTHGPVIAPSPDPERILGPQKIRRQIRYIHLNPCRARLVHDPLAWPLSTHLDAVGLAWPPVRRAVGDPHGLHRYISSDPSVASAGTDLPAPPGGLLTLDQVLAGVSAACRTPAAKLLTSRSPARRALVGLAKSATDARTASIAAFLGVSSAFVRSVPARHDEALAALAGDGRVLHWEHVLYARARAPKRRRWRDLPAQAPPLSR